MTIRRRILRATPAAAVFAALAVGIWMLTGTGFVESAHAEVAEAIRNTRAAEWVHFRMKQMDKELEVWFSANPPRMMGKAPDHIVWMDASTRRQFMYTPPTRTLKITFLPHEVSERLKKMSFFHVMLGVFEEAKTKHGAKLDRGRETVGDKTYILYTLTMPKEKGSMELRVDPTTKRVVSFSRKGGTLPGPEMVEVDYPQSGPVDIYALGVPRDAKIENELPPKGVLDLDRKVREARQAFAPSYYAITCLSGWREVRYVPQSVQVIYKKGTRFRLEEYGYVRGGIGKDVPVDDMKALEAWLVGRPVHRISFVTGPTTGSGTVVRLGRDGKLILRSNAGVSEKTIELLNWQGSSPPTVVRRAPPRTKKGDVGLERTMEGHITNGRVSTYPCRETMYFAPGRDYIVRHMELLWDAQAEWQKDKEWLKDVKDPASRNHKSRYVVRVLEYGQTLRGRWYARKILQEESGQRTGKGIRIVHLDTEREIPDGLFDAGSVTPDLFLRKTSRGDK